MRCSERIAPHVRSMIAAPDLSPINVAVGSKKAYLKEAAACRRTVVGDRVRTPPLTLEG
ncbi:MAG: hypothetical protein ABSH14_15150 [Verrucomicrobiia bacterium]|jgi:hypothetical protein